MITAGYFCASCFELTFGCTTVVWTWTVCVLPGSSSVFSTALASELYFTRRPVWESVGATWPFVRSIVASLGGRSIDCRTRLTSLAIAGLFQLTCAASSVLSDWLRRLRQLRANMLPC